LGDYSYQNCIHRSHPAVSYTAALHYLQPGRSIWTRCKADMWLRY